MKQIKIVCMNDGALLFSHSALVWKHVLRIVEFIWVFFFSFSGEYFNIWVGQWPQHVASSQKYFRSRQEEGKKYFLRDVFLHEDDEEK